MISFDFDYYRPSTLAQAVQVYQDLNGAGGQPLYYAGGTEIISQARAGRLYFQSVIDIKEIPECGVLSREDESLTIGSAVTLSQIREAGLFPLLDTVARSIADHTTRDKLTLGGNICGRTPYREAVLPFLLTDSTVMLAGPQGRRTMPLEQVFNGRMQLEAGEMLVQISVPQAHLSKPFRVVKKTKQEKVDYPLLTVAAVPGGQEPRAAVSGLCAYPFCFSSSDELPTPIVHDALGSAAYRSFVFEKIWAQLQAELGGMS